MRPGDIKILKADDGFCGWTPMENNFMSFPPDLDASFVPNRFRREVAELDGVTVEEMPLA